MLVNGKFRTAHRMIQNMREEQEQIQAAKNLANGTSQPDNTQHIDRIVERLVTMLLEAGKKAMTGQVGVTVFIENGTIQGWTQEAVTSEEAE